MATQRRTELPQWQALRERRQATQSTTIAALFAAERERRRANTIEAAGLSIDCSRHAIDDHTWARLFELARACEVESWRDRLLAGEHINNSEDRPAWHTALRTPPRDANAAKKIAAQRVRAEDFAEQLRAGRCLGATGAPIDTVVCIGIGGSDLGPRLVTEALGPLSGAPALHFVTNIDPTELTQALRHAQPERTALICISKSFSTLETLENTKAGLAWLRAAGVDAQRHLYAVSSQPDRAVSFGVRREQVLDFEDWVGGRYSVWSPCGLPVMIAHGAARFGELLAGAAELDLHFANTPLERNAPVRLGLLGVWYGNFCGSATRAVFAYAQRLRLLAAYLQQLEMESSGKRVDRDGVLLDTTTSPVVWGDAGTTAQHSVFQFLHQGTNLTPVDFVTCRSFATSSEERERLLHMNAVAQADALAFGDSVLGAGEAKPIYAQAPGNRPSTFIELPQLTAQAVGALLALYEQRTFVQSVLWNINAFDQWGVEIGKQLLKQRLAQGAPARG